MTFQGKGLIGAAALLLGSAAAAIGVTSKASWNKNNPVAKTWLSENNFSPRDKTKFADFVNDSNDGWFALGCHRVLLGEKNFRKLYSENNLTTTSQPTTSQPTTSDSDKDELPISDLFTDVNEPLLGCSTAHLKSGVYQYELALRQGDKGFAERISVHTDKIISQLVFYEKKPHADSSKPPVYKHLFGLYRYIKKDASSSADHTYKVANPNHNPSDSATDKWSDLTLSGATTESTSRYYSFWVDDTKGEGIFDNLGVKLNDKPFSSVAKDKNSSDSGASDFVYTNSMDTSKPEEELKAPEGNPAHYDLSVLDSLIERIQDKKGFWKSATEFCSNEPDDGARRHILEVKRLSQYCYKIKSTDTKAATSP